MRSLHAVKVAIHPLELVVAKRRELNDPMFPEIRSTAKILCACFLTLLFFIGCDRHLHDFELDERSFDRESMQMIQDETHLVLSTNAHGLNFFYKALLIRHLRQRLKYQRPHGMIYYSKFQSSKIRKFT